MLILLSVHNYKTGVLTLNAFYWCVAKILLTPVVRPSHKKYQKMFICGCCYVHACINAEFNLSSLHSVKEMVHFHEVLKHPAYIKDPLKTIALHIENSVAQGLT